MEYINNTDKAKSILETQFKKKVIDIWLACPNPCRQCAENSGQFNEQAYFFNDILGNTGLICLTHGYFIPQPPYVLAISSNN